MWVSFVEEVAFQMDLNGYGQENMGEGYTASEKIVSKDPKAEKHLVR